MLELVCFQRKGGYDIFLNIYSIHEFVLNLLCVSATLHSSQRMTMMLYLKNSTHSIHVCICLYGIFAYLWLIFIEHVGKYAIHGCYAICLFLIRVCSDFGLLCPRAFPGVDPLQGGQKKQL